MSFFTYRTPLYLPHKSLPGLLLQRPELQTLRLTFLRLSAMGNIFRLQHGTTSCSLIPILFLHLRFSSLTSIKTLSCKILWNGSERKESKDSRLQHGFISSLFTISTKPSFSFLTRREHKYVKKSMKVQFKVN